MWAALYGKAEHLFTLIEQGADVALPLKVHEDLLLTPYVRYALLTIPAVDSLALPLKHHSYSSNSYPVDSTALDIATITVEKTGSERKTIIAMLRAVMDDPEAASTDAITGLIKRTARPLGGGKSTRWMDWKASNRQVWRQWELKNEQRRLQKERERQQKELAAMRADEERQAALIAMKRVPLKATAPAVSAWLCAIGQAQYSREFEAQAVDGETLFALDDEHLRTELGVAALGHRLTLLRTRDALLSGGAVPAPSKVREHSPSVERCGPHVIISPAMLRSSNARHCARSVQVCRGGGAVAAVSGTRNLCGKFPVPRRGCRGAGCAE